MLNDDNSIDPLKRFKIIKEEDFVKVEILKQPKGEVQNENLKDVFASYNIALNRTEESKITF